MLYVSILVFIISALFGIVILIKWMTKQKSSKAVIYSHGIMALSALIMLVIYAFQKPNNIPTTSISLFIITAIGGMYMFTNDLRNKYSPILLGFIHGTIALVSLITLIIFTLS